MNRIQLHNIIKGGFTNAILPFEQNKKADLLCRLAFCILVVSWLDTGRAIKSIKFLTCNTGNSASTKGMRVRGLNHRKRD